MLILVLATIIMTVAAAYYSHNYFFARDIQMLQMHLQVSDRMGVNTGTDALWFGSVIAPASTSKFINISHNEIFPMKVKITVSGEMAQWMHVSENNFVLDPEKTVTIKIMAQVPKDTGLGNYTGLLYIDFKKVW